MLRLSQRRDPRTFDRGDTHVLYVLDMLDLMSTAAIRLGVTIMPSYGVLPR